MAKREELADVAAERAVLAGICRFGQEAYYEICGIIDSDCFTFTSNQLVYKCLQHLLKTEGVTIDMPSIWSAATDLKLTDLIKKQDEIDYLRSLFNMPIQKTSVRRLAIKVKKLSFIRMLRRKMYEIGDELAQYTGDEKFGDILSVPQNAILEFSTDLEGHHEAAPIGEGIEEYIKYLAENQRETVGVSTGMLRFDRMIGSGLLPGVNLLGARPKVGKTTFGDNVCLHTAGKLGIPTLNLDTEMTKKAHWDRLLAHISNVPINDIKTGKFARHDLNRRKVEDAGKILKAMPYAYESVIGLEMTSIISIVRRWLMRNVGFQDNGLANPCVIIYDYLKLASENALSNNIQEYQALGFQINELHNFVTKFEIPCLALIQLNRDGITREDSGVVSGSDRQVWACTSLCIFKKLSTEEIAASPTKKGYNRKLVQIAARFADEWDEDEYINLQMQGQFAKIIEGETRTELSKQTTQGELVNDNNIPTEARTF